MLRGIVVGFGVVLLVLSGVAAVRGARVGEIVTPAVLGALVVVGTVFERVRYRRVEASVPVGADWAVTGERFDDPEGVVEVWYNRVSGARRYVKVRGLPG